MESSLEAAAGIHASLDMKLPTGRLNRVVHDMLEARAPKIVGIKRFKVFYAVQTGSRPLRIRLFCNRVERLDPTYRRYLEKGLILQCHQVEVLETSHETSTAETVVERSVMSTYLASTV